MRKEKYEPSSKGFPDVPGDELDVDALCEIGDEVGVAVDEWRVVDGAEILFVDRARLVGDSLAGDLPASVPPAGYDVPGVADLHLPETALGDVVHLLGGGEIRGWIMRGSWGRHEGDGVERVFALLFHVSVDVVGGGTERRRRGGTFRGSSLE